MEEWERFEVGKPSGRPRWEAEGCVPLTTVTHSSHVGPALAIINDGEIRPTLVYDKSKLNTQRILVCWLSPNYWTLGSRYGNIDFRFDFERLIEGRNYYWVEAIKDYKLPACRILVTDIYRDLSTQLKRYDPTLGNGPWWFNKSERKHYYNGRYCLEFMIEAPIPLTMLMSLDFIKHSDQYCAMNRTAPSRCSEFGFSHIQGAARFLTRAAVMGIGLSSLVKGNTRLSP
jgi:hypothetical protein